MDKIRVHDGRWGKAFQENPTAGTGRDGEPQYTIVIES
jgi:hypothetical protein